MNGQTRREFLENSMFAATAAAMAGTTGLHPAMAQEAASNSPNEKLRVAVLGVNSRGGEHIDYVTYTDSRSKTRRQGVEIVAICDPDEVVGMKKGVEVVEKKAGNRPEYYKDLRKVFENKNIDIITIATPNHWHALAAIWAVQAGKDVYVEKPVSHNVSEGRRIVDAAERHKKIVQTGTQSRSSVGTRELMAFLHGGGIGEIKMARGLCYKPRGSIGPRGSYNVPASVDYDLWCGPAPKSPLTREKFHYDWHWQWDYGNGDLGNQGIHQMDLARWGLGVNGLGQGVMSYGGRVGYEDAGDTANTQVSVHDYGDKTLVFEVRGLKTDAYKGSKIGVIFYGSNGYAVMGSYEGGLVFDNEGKEVKRFNQEGDHFGNFVSAVKSRKVEDLHANIEQGHMSSALCHLGNVSYRLGEVMPVVEIQKRLESAKTKAECLETFDRVKQHLADNGISPESTPLRYGSMLSVDGKSETFQGPNSEKANPMLTREYRKGFEVPASAKLV